MEPIKDPRHLAQKFDSLANTANLKEAGVTVTSLTELINNHQSLLSQQFDKETSLHLKQSMLNLMSRISKEFDTPEGRALAGNVNFYAQAVFNEGSPELHFENEFMSLPLELITDILSKGVGFGANRLTKNIFIPQEASDEKAATGRKDQVWKGIAERIGCPPFAVAPGKWDEKVKEYCINYRKEIAELPEVSEEIRQLLTEKPTVANMIQLKEWRDKRDQAITFIVVFNAIGEDLSELRTKIKTMTRAEMIATAKDLSERFETTLKASAFDSLQRLDLHGNQLAVLPAEIGNLGSLQWLGLNGNRLAALPAEIGKLSSLLWLNLEGNQLAVLPAEIGNLGSLQVLNLEGNKLASLPTEIGKLSSLQVLNLEGNKLALLPAEIGKLGSLQKLFLTRNQLAVLPAEIGNLGSLQGLILIENKLAALPAEIGNLRSLQELYLDGNQLAALPAEIGNLGSLQRLFLTRNQLAALPAEIGKLGSLQMLYLNRNQLAALPAEIGKLRSLQRLNLLGNKLAALPTEIGKLGSLQWLILRGNQLALLPAEIGNLGSLQELYLEGNQLAALPAEIEQRLRQQGCHIDV